MSRYAEMKNRIRNEAIDFQLDVDNHCYSYGELAAFGSYFEEMGKRYGLLREFRENGICQEGKCHDNI